MLFDRSLIAACATAAIALALGACAQKDPYQAASAGLADGVLLPAYTQWTETDRRLAASARAFCAGNESLADARRVLRDAQLAWSGLQPMLVGPLGEGNRAWQVQFWPDKKNLVGRQVGNLLKANPDLTSADVEEGSVVVQGLTAYEYVLHDKTVDLSDAQVRARYCPLLIAIGDHQQKLSADILGQWEGDDGMASQLRTFPNARYADPNEAIADLLRVQVTALDALKKKLGTPLGRLSKGHPQPYQAEAWRSGASLPMIGAALAGAEALWQGGKESGLRSLVDDAHADLANRIDQAYASVRQTADSFDEPLAELVGTEEGRTRLAELYEQLDTLHRLHQNDLAQALGVQIGFNAHDGD
ncbi:imelysin family protein [Stutzerimonas urumqiensis]|uniref:imelysin family protein n=1 Tax=Stutzerimonas urumqiensis TaxID=638269 RepID=UPI000EAC5214|nr:imelysin family protein [Stutzerimonas urumqiensis]